ncbi:MAG: ABC transporter substrate-binding protein [Rhodomicrobium sp.]
MGPQFSRREVLAAACVIASLAPPGARAERKSVLIAGAVQFGTAQWLFDVIANNKLDAAEGFTLSQRLLASNIAADIALLGQQADIVVADWFWVMRQRSLGGDYLFMPFTAALGGVIVPEASPIKTVADLKGKEIGVAGGPIDKSWILLRAYGIKLGAGDLAATAKPVFGAPPLLNEQAALGRLDALLNFWPFAVRLEAKGWRRLIAVSDIVRSFGISGELPLVGFVFAASLAIGEPALMQGFARAVQKAQRILLESDQEWERIRPLMRAATGEEFQLLRDRYREGVLHSWNQEGRKEAQKLFEIVRETGGEDVTGPGVRFDPKAFWDGFVL